jgi:hypothetical protein
LSQAIDIEEGFSPIERAATTSIASENRAAPQNALVETAKGPFPLERFTATESSTVVISTGNGHRGRL